MKKHAARWLVPILKYGLGFGLLGWVIYKYWEPNPQTGAPGVQKLLDRDIAYEWLIAAALLLATTTCLQLYRWYLLVRALDLPTSVRNAYRLGLVGVYYNTFFPGSVGGDLLKAYFIAKAHPERKTRAVASVIADRAMGLFGLILFVAVSGSIAWALGDARIINNADLRRIVTVMTAIAAGSITGFLALGLLPARRVDRFAARLKWVPKVGTSLAEMWYAVWMYRQRLKVVVLGVCISAVAHCALVLSFHCASRVFPPSDPAAELASLSEHFVIAPIGFIVQAVPISPGGVGVGEAAFAGLYKISDRPEDRGVIARLSLRIVEWLLGFIGYIVFLRMRAEVIEVQHEVEEEQDQETADKERRKTEVK